MAVTYDSGTVPKGLPQRIPKSDTDVLDGMVIVDMKVALRLDGEIEQPVPRHVSQHMVKESDSGVNLALAGPIQIEPNGNIRLRSTPLDNSFSIRHKLSSSHTGCIKMHPYNIPSLKDW